MRKATFAVLALLVLISAGDLRAPPARFTLGTTTPPPDPRTGMVISPAAVLVEGNKIKQVGPPAQISVPAGAKIIDLGSATLLPGLIDAHTHLFLDIIV